VASETGDAGPEPAQRLVDAVRRIAAATTGREPTGVDHDHADEVLGTISSDDAVGFDPMSLLEALDRHRATTVIMGQVAGIMHGSTELTGDLDLLWSGSSGERAAMAAGFAEMGAQLCDNDDQPVATVPDSFTLSKLTFRSASASGDLCTPNLPWGDLDVAGMIDRADVATLDGVTLRYLTVADLVAMRSTLSRPKDIRRVEELRRLHADLT